MKFSYNWLQDHIVEKLPPIHEIEDVLSRKSLEVEEIAGDILDVKVLPHRQHDVFSHRGLARELSMLYGYKLKKHDFVQGLSHDNVVSPYVVIEDSKRCMRYCAARVDGITISDSPEWLKHRLESVGQRSINNVVDITNFIMNDIGQPMHAFDAGKVVGKISIRVARPGEKMMTLDYKQLDLNGTETVIADDEGVLALAGVKGGTKAIVDRNTTSIIFESANFDATATRKTSELHSVRTDSSKRYEAAITSEFSLEGIMRALQLIKEVIPNCSTGAVVDLYPKTEKQFKLGIAAIEVNALLGSSYSNNELEEVLQKYNFEFEKIVPKNAIQSLVSQIVGKPYSRLASTLHDAPNSFSCGSLVNWIYVQCGYPSPRIAIDMYFASKRVLRNDLMIGDLVFTNTLIQKPKNSMIFSQVLGMEIPDVPVYTKSIEFLSGSEFAPGIDHVGMYLGDGKILHTSSAIGYAVIEDLATSETFKNECQYGRLVNDLSVEQYVVTVPFERLDLRIKEDLIEEIGRVLGYDNLPSVLPKLPRVGLPNKRLYYENKIKKILFKRGFSEIYTYTFGDKGEVSIVKGLAADKEKLRTNLGDGVIEALQMNLRNVPLLGVSAIKVFEFGNVFTKEKEWRSFSIGIDDGKKKSNFTAEIENILQEISDELKNGDVSFKVVSTKPQVIEVDFDSYIEKLPVPTSYEKLVEEQVNVGYKTVSVYPFMLRDIAMWVKKGVAESDILSIIRNEAGPLLYRSDLFDVFEKETDGVQKTSYAFNLVFLSHERTLSDLEVNEIMARITNKLAGEGFEVR